MVPTLGGMLCLECETARGMLPLTRATELVRGEVCVNCGG